MVGTTHASGAVLDDLAGSVGGNAREATPGDAVAGVPAGVVASPATTEEASALLVLAARLGLTVVARGRGTVLGWGPPPRSADLVVDTSRLDGIVEHEAGDLVCTAEAGTRIDDVNAQVAGAGQQLALDQPVPGASLGGTLSTGRSGPRRMLYGTPRDLVVGITMVRADGVVAKAGGKVVKNVAGYDLAKLLGGAYGTLGIVTRMVVRLHPLPPSSRWLTCSYPDLDAAAGAAAAVTGSQLFPTAVEVRRSAGAAGADVQVLLEGTERGVRERAAAAAELLGDDAGEADLDTADVARLDGPSDAGLLVKVAVPLTGIARLLHTTREIEDRLGLSCGVVGSAGVGVLHVQLADVTGETSAAVQAVELLRNTARQTSGAGSAVVLHAPAEVRAHVDSWGPITGLDLMRRVKDEFDPDHRLSAGRFVGGI